MSPSEDEVGAILAQTDSDDDIDDGGITLEDILNEDNVESEDFTELDNRLYDFMLEKSSSVVKPQPKVNQFVGRTPLEIAESREKKLLNVSNKEIVSPLQVKRSLRARSLKRTKSSVPSTETTDTRDQLYSGVCGGVVKVEPMAIISRQLQKNLQFRARGPGSPTALAIHSKFMAIGTSKSLVLVFDHFQNVRQVLGNVSDAEADGPVTAIDVSRGSDFLVCGYQSGRIVLWDMLKGTSLKAVSDAHEHPVVNLRFYKDQKPHIISVDTNGIVNKLNFSKMMGYMYIVDIDLILDGAAGKIPAISVLPSSIVSSSKTTSITEQYSLVALSSDRVTFILSLEPEVKVLHRWNKPDDINEEDHLLPSLSFGWNSTSTHHRPSPILARGWGKHLQFLEFTYIQSEKQHQSESSWPSFELKEELVTKRDLVAIQWLGDSIIVYLNLQDELCIYDSMSRQELEVVDISSTELVYAVYKDAKKEGKSARSFANSFRSCNDILYLLGLKVLQTVRFQSWTQRIDSLIEDGEWLEALALALDHYESLKKVANERAERDRFAPVFFRNQQNDQCVVDIFRMCQTNQRTREKQDVQRDEDGTIVEWTCGDIVYSPDISNKLESAFQSGRNGNIEANIPMGVIERVGELLMDYVRLAIANAPSCSCAASSSSSTINCTCSISRKSLDLAKSHYQMLAGVCIEYCCTIGRTDLLFGDIYRRFQDCHRSDIFVGLLEPYILNRKLQYLSPQVMHEFVQQYTANGQFTSVEQCLVHLKVKQVDFDTILRLCEQHKLYSALIYVYNAGLNDYVTPIDILLKACQPFLLKVADSVKDLKDSSEDRCQRLYGYKLLVYISYCFTGKAFPSGDIPSERRNQVRNQVCVYLFTENIPQDQKKVEENSPTFPRLRLLVAIDTKEFLGLLAPLFDGPDTDFEGTTPPPPQRRKKGTQENSLRCPSRLSMLLALAEVIVGKPGEDPSLSKFSSFDQAQLHMFEAKLICSGAIDAEVYAKERSGNNSNYWMMDSLLHFLAVGSFPLNEENIDTIDVRQLGEIIDKDERQATLVRLLQKLPKTSYHVESLLKRVKKYKLHRAEVLLYKERNDFTNTVRAYVADSDQEFRLNVFAYIRNEHDKITVDEQPNRQTNTMKKPFSFEEMENGIIESITSLLQVDCHALVVLVLELFPQLHTRVIRRLIETGGNEGSNLEFVYLKHLLSPSGEGGEQAELVRELLERSKLRVDDDPKVQERYVSLLCRFEPDNVFPYLESHGNYSLETCLRLCQEYKITDAEAYLLERTGDITGALSLILQTIEQKLKILKPALRGFTPSVGATSSLGRQQQHYSIIENVPEGRDVMKSLEIAITLCQRNSARYHDEQSEKLWFTLLDTFLQVQNYIKRSIQGKSSSKSNVTVTASTRGTQTSMQIALNEYIRFILERMAASVSLQAILFKITNEHAKDEFGEFKPTITGMLDTYHYEQNIYQIANRLISVDLYEQVSILHRDQSKCLAPASNICFYCGVHLNKPPFGMENSAGEKWNSLTSTTMVLAVGRTFHESCGILRQQEIDAKANMANNKRIAKEKDLEERNPSFGSANDENTNKEDRVTRNEQQNTRRYLNRLKRSRKLSTKLMPLNQVLDSLSTNQHHGKKKYVYISSSAFSLAPMALPKVKRIGSRPIGALPVKPAQVGGIK